MAPTTAPLLLAALALAMAASAPAQTPGPKAGSALVIGAGISGLSAAESLCAKGWNVAIVEGRARTGGRVFTTKLPVSGAQVEAGAGWLHDASTVRNSLFKWAQDNAIATQVDDEEDLMWTLRDATSPGSFSQARSNAYAAKAGQFEDLIASQAEDYWTTTVSLKSKFDAWVAGQNPPLTAEMLAGVRTIIQSGSADLEYGASMDRLSARWCDEGEQGNADERIIKSGYSSVIASLEARIRGYASCRNAFNLNAQVVGITVTASPANARGVYAKLANGTTIAGKFAINTLPLGVLKSGKITFTPALSSTKTTALSKLQMGLLNKVVLSYDRDFWSAEGAGGAPWPYEASWFVPVTNYSKPEGSAHEFWNHQKFYPGTNTVSMLVGGDTALFWEKLGEGQSLADRDKMVAAKADALFRQMFPSAAAVLRDSLVTRWQSDPFSLGSYSYIPVGGAPGQRTKLCAAQSDLLWWAGEHCSAKYPSTANGAYDTGKTAATAALAKFTTFTAGRR